MSVDVPNLVQHNLIDSNSVRPRIKEVIDSGNGDHTRKLDELATKSAVDKVKEAEKEFLDNPTIQTTTRLSIEAYLFDVLNQRDPSSPLRRVQVTFR